MIGVSEEDKYQIGWQQLSHHGTLLQPKYHEGRRPQAPWYGICSEEIILGFNGGCDMCMHGKFQMSIKLQRTLATDVIVMKKHFVLM